MSFCMCWFMYIYRPIKQRQIHNPLKYLRDHQQITFVIFLGVLHQRLHQQLFSVNFSEIIQNYLEEDFCHKNVFKTPLTPTPSTANCLFDKSFLLMLPKMKFCFSKYIQEVHFWWVSVKCFKKAKQSQLRVEYFE